MLLLSPPQIICLCSLKSLKPLVGKTERYTLYCATCMGFAGVASIACLSATCVHPYRGRADTLV